MVSNRVLRHGILKFYLPVNVTMAVPLYLIHHFHLPQELALLYVPIWTSALMLYTNKFSHELFEIEKEEYMKDVTNISDDTDLVLGSYELKNTI